MAAVAAVGVSSASTLSIAALKETLDFSRSVSALI